MFAVNVTVLNTTWQIIIPKIKIARSGHDLNLKSILRERSSYRSQRSDTYERQSISIEDPRLPYIRFAELNRTLKPLHKKCRMSRYHSWTEHLKHDSNEHEMIHQCQNNLNLESDLPSRRIESKSYDVRKNIQQALKEISPKDLVDDVESTDEHQSPNDFKNGYIITKGHMPPRRFVSQILSTLDILWRICSVVSAEESPTLNDWHVFKARVTDLSKQCSKARFDWGSDRLSMKEESKEEFQEDFENDSDLSR